MLAGGEIMINTGHVGRVYEGSTPDIFVAPSNHLHTNQTIISVAFTTYLSSLVKLH